MERLPAELFDIIIGHVAELRWEPNFLFSAEGDTPSYDDDQLQPRLPSLLQSCALVCRRWQAAFEKLIWAEIKLKSCDLDLFEAAFQTLHRRAYIRSLFLAVILPEYDDHARCRFERSHDQRANDRAFTSAVARLLRILNSWEGGGTDMPESLSFCIWAVYSASDEPWTRGSLEAYTPVNKEDLEAARYAGSTIRLLTDEDLPEVSFIDSFSAQATKRTLDLAGTAEIAARFPNLRKVDFRTDEIQTRPYYGIHRDARHSFAQALSRNTYPNVREVDIDMWNPPPDDQKLRVPDLVHPFDSDPLSRAVHDLSLNLRSLTISGVFDSSLLWPYEHTIDAENPPALWPALETLRVNLQITTPAGSWYFKRRYFGRSQPDAALEDSDEVGTDNGLMEYPPNRPAVDDPTASDGVVLSDYFAAIETSWDRFRGTPDNDRVRPVVFAFACAARHMPVLEMARLAFVVPTQDRNIPWAIAYRSPSIPSTTLPHANSSRRIELNTGDWEPDSETMALLCDIGRGQHGGDMEVRRGKRFSQFINMLSY